MKRRGRSMHLDGPAECEDFLIREGVSPEGDDEPEWLDNENGPNFDEEVGEAAEDYDEGSSSLD